MSASSRARACLPVALAAVLAAIATGVPGARATQAATPGASAASEGAGEAGLGPVSEAERLLFQAPHMATVTQPVTITYDYTADASGQHAADHAVLMLSRMASGACCAAHAEYLSGPQAISLPDLDQPVQNPLLLYFLEDQVRLLERSTHGQAAHFRRRIRLALSDAADVTAATTRWNGKDVPAHIVHVAPFLTDPYRARFEHDARTEYTFVISDAVPGGIARMTATLPAEKAGDPPLAERTLVLADPQPAVPARK